ncbi:MFS transporter [Priestia megaterium]
MSFKDLHFNIKVRFFEMFLSNLLGNMIFPFLAIYLSQNFGVATAGVLMTINIIAGFIAGIYGGPLADRIGRRRIIIAAEIIRFLSYIFMAISNSSWFDAPLLTYFMIVTSNISGALAQPATEAMLVDCSRERDRPLIYSISYWSWNITVLIGGIIGGFFFQSHRFEIFLSGALVSLIAILIVLFYVKETYVPNDTNSLKITNPISFLTSYKVVFLDKIFLLFCLGSLLCASIELMALNYTSIRLANDFKEQVILSIQDWEISADGIKMFGILNSENALFVAVLGLVVPKLIRRFKESNVLLIGIIVYALGYGFFTFVNNVWLLFLVIFFATVGELIWIPIKQTMLARIVPDNNRSTYLAFNGMVLQMNMLLGSLAVIIGAFLPPIGMGVIFLTFGCASIIIYGRVLGQIRSKRDLNKAS